jgi:hypothetical protein
LRPEFASLQSLFALVGVDVRDLDHLVPGRQLF